MSLKIIKVKLMAIFYLLTKIHFEIFLTKKKINSFNKKNHFRHICFEVDNIKKFKKKFINKNKNNITRGKTDGILQFFTKDLEGNIIEFHQRDRKSKF